MRAVWIIACVLAVTGPIYAQPPAPVLAESEAPSSDTNEVRPAASTEAPASAETAASTEAPASNEASDEAPATGETPIEPDDANVEIGGEVSETNALPANVDVDEPRIERIESADAVLDEELPPSERSEPLSTASSPSAPPSFSPWKGYFGFGSGLALHLNPREGFQQNTLAPAYLSLRGGGVVPGQGRLRHGVQLGVSTNLSREGAYPSGTLALRQWVIVPSYVLRLGLDESPLPAWIATARLGLPVVVSPDLTIGAELALGAQYFVRSGFGIFAEVIYDVFVGGRERDDSRSTHHLLTIEVGLQFELEVLP